jgi:hypothetical protein
MPRGGQGTQGMSDMLAPFNEIEAIQNEVRKHISAIEELYTRIAAVAGGGGGVKVRAAPVARRGRPAGSGGGGGRAKRGELKAAIHKLLAGGKPMTPSDVVRALPTVGFKSASKPNVIYNTVYLSLRKDKAIQKTSEGFTLKGNSGKAAAGAKK